MKAPRTLSFNPTEGQTQYNLQMLGKVLAGNVAFGATTSNTDKDINISCYKATGITPGVANTEFSIIHSLRRIPIGFLVASVDQAATIYKSTTAWTNSTIYLKCSGVSVNYFVILI